jgi:lipopolysaccharide export system protein LptA
MKKLFFLLVLGLCLAAVAQTPPKQKGQKEPVGDTEINADRFDYIAESSTTNGLLIATNGLLIYTGHVLVENLRAKILCDRLVIFLPKNGEEPNRIEAQTNVVIVAMNNGETTRATCSLAVYTRSIKAGTTNRIVTLTGNPLPYIENAKGSATGTRIDWNLATEDISGLGIRMNIKQSTIEGSGTNKSPVKLF